MKRILYFILFICISIQGIAQTDNNKFNLKFTGFVSSQLFFDTRQTVAAREGLINLFPKAPDYDLNGYDINSRSSLNHSSMASRLRANISGPDVWGAKAKAVIEGDFTGVSNTDNNGFRLREAYVKLLWENTSLLVGATWHPMFVVKSFPMTVGLSAGAPFHAFSRQNQIKVEHRIGNSNFIFFAGMQRDYASKGIQGTSSIYQRNSGIPNFHFQYQLSLNKHLIGFGLDYKQLLPLTSFTNDALQTYATNKKLHSYAFMAFAKFDFKPIVLKSQFIIGQNLADLIMLGGYTVNYVAKQTQVSYTNASQISYWLDLSTKGETIKFGLFAGYAKNRSGNLMNEVFYGIGSDIDYLYRFSPRVEIHSNKFMWATEFEYTAASFFENEAAIKGNEVNNLRIVTGLFYFF